MQTAHPAAWAEPVDGAAGALGDALGDTPAEDAPYGLADPLPAAEAAADAPYIVGEMEGMRGPTTKQFRLSDGSYMVAEYGMPVHVEAGRAGGATSTPPSRRPSGGTSPPYRRSASSCRETSPAAARCRSTTGPIPSPGHTTP
jgi:hypothetical protein